MQTLGLLTGVGYADARPFACLMADEGCAYRFTHQFHLEQHMHKVHGWTANGTNGVFADGTAAEQVDDGFGWDADHASKIVCDGGMPCSKWDEMFGEEAMALDPALL
jgi:hypothetical protein